MRISGPNMRAVTEEVKAIPPERFGKKILRSSVGAGVCTLGIWLVGDIPWPAYVGLIVVGAHIISAELVEKAVAFVVATFKDLFGVVRGKS